MSVDLVPEWTIGDLCLTSYPFGVDADSTVDIGEPDMVVETATSMLADGDLERVVRYGNRTYVIPFYVMGATLGELAEAEALLRTEIKKTGLTLTHDPGDGFTPASVYEVQTAQLTPERNDDHESHLIRKFTLTLTCAPFARSAELTTVAAYAPGSTTVSVDTCDSVTGWSSTRSGSTATVVNWIAGAVGVVELDAAVTSPETWTLTRSGSVDFTSTPFLVAEIRTLSQQQGLRVSATANGVTLPVVESQLMNDGNAFHRVVYDASGVGTAPSITFTHTSIVGEPWQGIYIREVSRTNIPPSITARQVTRVIQPGGTERTPASIHVTSADEAAGLGWAVVHTSPEDGSGYAPPLRRWRSTGQTPIVDSGMMSGAYESISVTGVRYDTPTSALPEGGYLLAALMRRSSEGTEPVAWSTSTIFPGGATEQGFTNGTEFITFPDTDWHVFPIAVLSLPSVRTKAGQVRTILQALTSGGPTTYVDEAWLFRLDDDCALTVVRPDALAHVWLDSPDLSSPVPTVWMGDLSSTKVHPGDRLKAMGAHVLSPTGTTVFAGTLTPNPRVSASFYRRWHSNAAE